MFQFLITRVISREIYIQKPAKIEFDLIKQLINLYELDNRDLHIEQFLVAKENNQLLGFGRIKTHKECDELCSLGVLETMRRRGIAKLLVKVTVEMAVRPIYLVCIIPEYFKKLGFVIVNHFPDEIEHKLNYCTSELQVPEKYVVMKFEP